MKLEDMKRIAGARNKGEWEFSWNDDVKHLVTADNGEFTIISSEISDAEDLQFAAMASNQWDKLMAVVEAAKAYFTEHDLEGLSEKYFKDYHAVKKALEALEAE